MRQIIYYPRRVRSKHLRELSFGNATYQRYGFFHALSFASASSGGQTSSCSIHQRSG